MSVNTLQTPYRVRSFVRREGRQTEAQKKAYVTWMPKISLSLTQGILDLPSVFGKDAPCYLEIGFGTGQSLLALAKQRPQDHFIGVETHRPGLGALCLGVAQHELSNLRVFYGDVIDVLQHAIPQGGLAGAQIFFPDPWPKRRHHERRLIQPAFLKILLGCLAPGGVLHLATDWEDYAKHMVKVLEAEPALCNLADQQLFAKRSPMRPIITKFEQRALSAGRQIWELQYRYTPIDKQTSLT